MNKAARALKRELPAGWRDSVYGDGEVAAFGAADPGDPETDFVEVREYEPGEWTATVGGYSERRGMGDVIEAAGPFSSPGKAAKAAGDLVRKHFYGERGPGEHMRERNYGRSQPFGNAMDRGDFDFGGGWF